VYLSRYESVGDTIVQLRGQDSVWLNRDSQFNEEIEMKLSRMYRTALIATTMLILSSGLDVGGFAQTNSMQGAKNILLVHAAWADESCRSAITVLLQAKGFHVVPVQNPLTSLADDVPRRSVSSRCRTDQ
jgi:hypothetical protein